MNPPITITFDNPDPLDCPTNVTEFVALLQALSSGEIVGDFIPYVTGAATPAVDDQDKVWHKTDANGRPLGTYVYYGGTWRRQYSGNIGAVQMYSGDPAIDFAGAGGAGTVGGEWDGWQLCNGSNGSPNLSDKFIVGAKMDDLGVGYPAAVGPWQTTVSGATTQTGGAKDITLTDATTYQPAVSAVTAGKYIADGHTADAGGDLLGIVGTNFTLKAAIAEHIPAAIPTLPNYYSLAFVTFRGYA